MKMKKKRLLKGLALVLGLVLLGCGDHNSDGGMFGSADEHNSGGSAEAPITIKQAKTLPDGTFVVVEGKIEKVVGNELVFLNDGTDTINVEIDDHLWYAFTVGTDAVFTIHGEIDRDWNGVEIEAKKVVRK